MTPTPTPAAALEGLHDVVSPAPVSLMPATPAWLVLGALVLALLLWGALLLVQRRRRGRYRREAAAELRALEAQLATPQARVGALAALPVLVKRVVLETAGRPDVAPLSGEPWLRFLDRTWREPAFTSGPGRCLPILTYGTPAERAALAEPDVAALVALLRRWIPGHHAATPDEPSAVSPAPAEERAA